ncbi:MAG: hypothetical protein PHD78_02455 [Bacilli bacterium]|nr:hypothetical protein [Bacilli bacterium]MDD4053565.1 hypothetical protein [Bacilli bacterium]MDD4411468.1 hypothetical protein [Bacilli bacterium]
MRKAIDNNRIVFLDENNQEIMYIDYSTDECIWYFPSNGEIVVTEEMDLFNLLNQFMKQKYLFYDNNLGDYKDEKKLIWHSDCYYNPDDEWSKKSVSYLNIEKNSNYFRIWCIKPLDKIVNRPRKNHCIGFSPLGNGKMNKNIETCFTLQDDFVTMIYQNLKHSKILKKSK